MIDQIDKSINVIQKLNTIFQKRRSFLIISLIILFFFIVLIFKELDLNEEKFINILPNLLYLRNILILFTAIELAFLIFWIFLRRLPKFSNDEIGFILAIRTDDEKVKIRIKNDFIEHLKTEMKNIGINVNIKYLSEYHCEKLIEKIKKKSVSKYHYKTKAKLIVYGNAIIRMQNGDDCYYLKLNESVTHEPIPIIESQKIAGQMKLSFPQEAIFQIKNEIFGFKLTGKLYGIASKYILGISCLYSGKVNLALKFHLSIIDGYNSDFESIPHIKNVIENTKKLIFEESMYLAKEAFLDLNDLNQMEYYLNLGFKYHETAWYYLLISIIYFKKYKNIEKSLEALEMAKKLNKKDYTWAYSKAFLLAYKGDLSGAYQTYKLAFRNLTSSTAHLESEIFIRQILVEDPTAFQLYYCLGLIYYFAHEDIILAEEAFKKFKNLSEKNGLFLDQIKYVDKYLEKILKGRNC